MREITSAGNQLIKQLRSLREKKHRREHRAYLVEGEKIVREALASAALIQCVITCDKQNEAARMAEAAGLDVILTSRSILVAVSDTKTPPDVAACVRMEAGEKPAAGRFFIVTDGISDPKNLGTIIRTADAVAADGVLVSPDSADPYGPKCQRAAMGSMFHIPVFTGDAAAFMEGFRKDGGRVVAGMLEGTALPPEQTFDRVCLVIGNESRGVSDDTRRLADLALRIPIYGRAESLNAAVAAGIMMYDIRKVLRG